MSPNEAPRGAKHLGGQGEPVEPEDETPIGHRTPLWHTRWNESANEVREFVVADYFKKPSLLQRMGAWLRGARRGW